MELSKVNWGKIKDILPKVAILPWGSTEAQGTHLPYSTDTFEAEYIAKNIAISVKQTIVLPSIHYGVNSAQLGVPFTLSINPSTQFLLLKDIVKSLEYQKINKLIIINAHGGNTFVPIIRELFLESKVFIVVINTNSIINNHLFFDNPGEHAGERATSIMMHIDSNLVDILPTKDFEAKRFKIEELNQGWAWAQREWTSISQSNCIGNPENANAEKGNTYLKAIIEKTIPLVQNLVNADLDDLYK